MSGGGGGGGGGQPFDPAALGGRFGNQLSTYLSEDPPVFDENLHTGMNPWQNNGLDRIKAHSASVDDSGFFGRSLSSMDDVIRSGGIDSGMRWDINHADDAARDYASMADSQANPMAAPGYAALRKKLSDDVTTQSLSAFNGDGMYGSDANKESLAEGLGTALGGMDYQNYSDSYARRMAALGGQQGAAGQGFGMRQQGQDNVMAAGDRMGSRFADLLAPGQAIAGVGEQYGADAQGRKLGEFDQFNRTKNAKYNRFRELLGDFTGSQGNAGMEEQVPFWQQLLGYVAGNAGQAMQVMGGR